MKSAIVAALLALLACSARAQNNNWYVGGSFGQSMVEFDEDGLAASLRAEGFTGNTGFQSDETDDAFKFFGGYRVNRYLAVEASYLNLGEVSSKTMATGIAGPRETIFKVKWKNGYSVAAVGTLPLGERFALMGRAGLYYANITSSVQIQAFGSGASSDKDTGPTLGAGVSFEINKTVGIRAEYERFFAVGTDNTGEGDFDFMSVGVVLRF